MKRISALLLSLVYFFSGVILITSSSVQVTETEPQYQSAAYGTMSVGGISERIDYTRKEVSTAILNPAMASYAGINCAVTAGGSIIAWFNKNLDLIPNHTPGIQVGNVWIWTSQNTAINNMFSDLNTRMGGGGSSGATILQYKWGIASYVDEKGYALSIANAYGGTNTMAPAFYTAIQEGKPTSLFFSSYNIASSISSYDGYDTVSLTQYSGNHAMVAYGYYEVSYFNEYDTMFRKDTYLYTRDSGFINILRINSHCELDDAFITCII